MSEKIGFIGGGQMGEALIKGIISAGLYKAEHILVAEPDSSRAKYLQESYSITVFDEGATLWSECSIVILAVKPQIMKSVLSDSKSNIKPDHLIISVAAGLPISFYKEQIGLESCKIIRVMPNTPALIMEGASAICRSDAVTNEELTQATEILDRVGLSVVLEEKHLDAVTGLSGSGPAYVFSFIEAMIDGGVKMGLTRDTAQQLTTQTILGSVKLLEQSQEHPAVLRSKVTSPGGTTIAGLHVLEKQGFSGIVMEAIQAATNRSIELGSKE